MKHSFRCVFLLLLLTQFFVSSSTLSAQVIRHLKAYTVNGDDQGDQLGLSVSGTGDVNGDGQNDFIVGIFLDDNQGGNSGSARVVSGADGSTLYTFNGDNAGINLVIP